ncbi:hypothetical protein AVEN_97251-1 [Araneus ventricosus]|uniref:Uncharacterized protein n=1 Tax=Araneus ventricosus TaxID=182803 RepID=A0A4Y2JER5_ARAVE|nr:hypothetical protein AVEN_97251-1 [Araneus ventricosus]
MIIPPPAVISGLASVNDAGLVNLLTEFKLNPMRRIRILGIKRNSADETCVAGGITRLYYFSDPPLRRRCGQPDLSSGLHWLGIGGQGNLRQRRNYMQSQHEAFHGVDIEDYSSDSKSVCHVAPEVPISGPNLAIHPCQSLHAEGYLGTDLIILKHGQITRMQPDPVPYSEISNVKTVTLDSGTECSSYKSARTSTQF